MAMEFGPPRAEDHDDEETEEQEYSVADNRSWFGFSERLKLLLSPETEEEDDDEEEDDEADSKKKRRNILSALFSKHNFALQTVEVEAEDQVEELPLDEPLEEAYTEAPYDAQFQTEVSDFRSEAQDQPQELYSGEEPETPGIEETVPPIDAVDEVEEVFNTEDEASYEPQESADHYPDYAEQAIRFEPAPVESPHPGNSPEAQEPAHTEIPKLDKEVGPTPVPEAPAVALGAILAEKLSRSKDERLSEQAKKLQEKVEANEVAQQTENAKHEKQRKELKEELTRHKKHTKNIEKDSHKKNKPETKTEKTEKTEVGPRVNTESYQEPDRTPEYSGETMNDRSIAHEVYDERQFEVKDAQRDQTVRQNDGQALFDRHINSDREVPDIEKIKHSLDQMPKINVAPEDDIDMVKTAAMTGVVIGLVIIGVVFAMAWLR